YPEPFYRHRMAALGASQHDRIAAGNITQIRVQKCRQRHAISLTAEAVAKTVEENVDIVVIGGKMRRALLTLIANLLQQFLGLFSQIRWHDDVDVRIKLAVAIGTQARHAFAVEHDGFSWLGAWLDIDLQRLTIEVFNGEGGA